MSKSLAKAKQTDLVGFDDIMQQDAGCGLEEATQDSFALPILSVLQSMSQAVQDDDSGAVRPGLIYDSTLKQSLETVTVVPVYYQQRFLEWVPRDNGGGLVDIYTAQNKPGTKGGFGKHVLENGNELVDTRIHYVLVLTDEEAYPAMISMSSTDIKTSKHWCSLMRRQKLAVVGQDGSMQNLQKPTFAKAYTLSTIKKQKDTFKWFGWDVSLSERELTANEYAMAKQFNAEIKSDSDKYDAQDSLASSNN